MTCTVRWQTEADQDVPAPKTKSWPKSLRIFKQALDGALADFGARTRPFADNLEVLAVDREKVRIEFMKAYPADSRKAKGEAFRRCERDAIASSLVMAREIGPPESSATVFWAASPGAT